MNRLFRVSAVAVATVALVAMPGCGSSGPSEQEPPVEVSDFIPAVGHEEGHDHPTEGPHGGHLVELGDEEYHAELLHDESTHTVTVHLLDAAGKQPVAIDQPDVALQLFKEGQFVKYALKAAASRSGASGASEFSLIDEKLCDTLRHAEEVRGRLNVTIEGKQYTGMIEHHAH